MQTGKSGRRDGFDYFLPNPYLKSTLFEFGVLCKRDHKVISSNCTKRSLVKYLVKGQI